MSKKQHLRAISLADHYYVLLQKITKGEKSVVWEALQWPAGTPLSAEVEAIEGQPQEYIELLREWVDPGISEPPFEEPGGGRWVAIKVPRVPAYEQEIVREAARLRDLKDLRLSEHQPGKARAVQVIADLWPTARVPILIMEWVSGVQLSSDKAPIFEEFKGLRVGLQLVAFLDKALLYGMILTDTVKADSLFYDDQTSSLILIDWNTVGERPEDFRDQTVPIVGQTLYRLFTGELIEFKGSAFNVDGSRIGDNGVAKSWDRLTHGTRALITALSLGQVAGSRPDQLAPEIFSRMKGQIDLWGTPTSSLLARARVEAADVCLNCYDVTRALGADLNEDDNQRYYHAVHEVLWTYQAGQHDAALAFLNWARRQYREDPEVRWAWLAHRAGVREPGLWQRIEPALADLRARDHQQAQTALREVEKNYPRVIELRALAAETGIWAQLSIGNRRPTVAHAGTIVRDLKGLVNLWESRQEDGTGLAASYGTQWMATLWQQVDEYLRRANRVEQLRQQLSEKLQTALQTRDISTVVELLRNLQANRSGDEGLEIWLQTAEVIEVGRAEEALELLTRVDETEVSRVLKHVAAMQLKQRGQGLVERNHFSEAVKLLEQVVQHCRDDREAERQHDQYRERASRYEELWREFQSAQKAGDLARQADVLSELLRERFRYAPDDTPLTDRWLECRVALVRQQADDGFYATAIKMSDDTLGELREFGLSQEEQQRLGELAHSEFEQIDQKREQVASDLLGQAVEWTRRTDLGLDEALDRAATALVQAQQYDPRYSKDFEAIRAFQHGRRALLHTEPDYTVAASEFSRAMAWIGDELDVLRETIRPYAGLAEVGTQLVRLPEPETASLEDIVRTISQCNRLDDRLERWDGTVPERWGDDRLTELHRELGQEIDKRRRRSHEELNKSLIEWLQNVAQADAALDYQETFARLDKVLPLVEQAAQPAIEPGRWVDLSVPRNRAQSEQALREWGRRVRTLYNLALTQAHLLRAEVDLWRGREDLVATRSKNARRAAEAAVEGGYTGPWPDRRLADAGLREETRRLLPRLLRDRWIAVYREVKKTGMVSVGLQQAAGLNEDLVWLGDQYLESLDPEQAEEAFNLLLEAKPEGEECFVSLLAHCGLTDCQKKLCTYAHAARLVKRQKYCDALGLVDLANQLNGGQREKLEQAVVDQMKAHWARVFDRLKEGQPLAQVLDEALKVQDKRAAEARKDAVKLNAFLAELDRQYRPRLEPEATDLAAVAESAFSALEKGERETFADKLAKVPVELWEGDDGLRKAIEKKVKAQYDNLVEEFIRKPFMKQTLLVWKGHIGRVLEPARRAAEDFSGCKSENWDQVKRAHTRGILLRIVSVSVLLLLLGGVGVGIGYTTSPPFRDVVRAPIGWVQRQFSQPIVTPTPPPRPQGDLTVVEGELHQAGTEVWYPVGVENTGEVTATFEIHPTPDISGDVFWMRYPSSRLEGWPQATLVPGELRTFWLVVPRRPPGFEPEQQHIQLRLVVEGEEIPFCEALVIPSQERLEITGWSLDQAGEEYVRQVHLQASGAFTPSLTGQYGVACYDGGEERRGDHSTIHVDADGRGMFMCPLDIGAPGQWHVAAFPLHTDGQESWEPPQARPPDGFPHEHPFAVREPHYGLTVTKAITHLFDPAEGIRVVGLRYEVMNTGEIPDRFTVEFVPISNTESLSLTLVLPGNGKELTHTLELTTTTGPVPLFPDGYRLAPCLDLSAPDCPVVHLEIWAYYPVAPRREGEKRLLEPPVTFELVLRPQAGEGEPVVEPVKVTELP